MASKRVRYSESSTSDTESDNDVENYDHTEYNKFNTRNRKQREPKSFSKNALMARENRLKKKLYMENLERELTKERQKNKKYVNILKQQSETIRKHEREIKYMRGVLANNSDISKLLKTLHFNTGLSVGTSLNKNFTINANKMEDRIEKNMKILQPQEQSPSDVIIKELHPWSDAQLNGLSHLTPPQVDNDMDQIFDNFDFTLDTQCLPGLDLQFEDLLDVPPISPSLDDHNYTLTSSEIADSDEGLGGLGVCLHISNHKVSLEYCSKCHENSNRVWSEEDCF